MSFPMDGDLQDVEVDQAKFYTIKPNELTVQCLIASGSFARVYKALWRRSFGMCSTEIVVALKELSDAATTTARDRETLTMLMDHAHIVRCYDSTLDPPYLIVSEFCAGGTLFDQLHNSDQDLALRQQIKILRDIASGMKFLHEQDEVILHRDLKSSNVLLTRHIRGLDQVPHAKVADFGLSRESSKPGARKSRMTAGVGTWRWMAPEVLMEEAVSYGCAADVYSFGIVMFEVLLREMPYIDKFKNMSLDDPRICLHVLNGTRPSSDRVPSDYPPELRTMMESSWDGDTKSRPAFTEIEATLSTLYGDEGSVVSL